MDTESADALSRRERAAIAAQACQTCRTRKSKCDEQRPKCGLCQRLDIDCEYRQPVATKKDKTMLHILDALTRLETKIDNFALYGSALAPVPKQRQSLDFSQTSTGAPPKDHLTIPHRVITWPAIYLHLIHSGIQATTDLQYVLQTGTPWLIHHEIAKHPLLLPSDIKLPTVPVGSTNQAGQSARLAFPTLTVDQIQKLSHAYFNTFNVLYPILDQDSFLTDVGMPLLREGYDEGDPNAILALLVYALGQVALEGVLGPPIRSAGGMPSGLRGGSLQEPPGIWIFNEARRRLGFVVNTCSIENVQIQMLQAIYYEANSRHLDFWQSIVSASMACQVLVRCHPIEWTSREGDMIRRAFWACALCETQYHLDLDLPETGIQALEDTVPVPFSYDSLEQNGHAPERSHMQYHFLAMLGLRRLIASINKTILEPSIAQAETTNSFSGPAIQVVREMARQLDSWRSLLPRPLQWLDSDMLDYPDAGPTNRRIADTLFSPDQGTVPIRHLYNLDVVTAQLRTRFYYARFLMYQPFIYKALHFPELMTSGDANYCALAIKSACLWPIAMAPPKDKKRLVPHLFSWTQNFLSILLIFEMTRRNDCLRQICDDHVNSEHVQRTVALMLDWMRDMRQVDGIADWSWGILEPLFMGQSVQNVYD